MFFVSSASAMFIISLTTTKNKVVETGGHGSLSQRMLFLPECQSIGR